MGAIRDKASALGYALPAAPESAGSYTPIKLVGQRFRTSGVLPIKDGKPMTGRGGQTSIEELQAAARQVTLNILALLDDRLGEANEILIDHLRGFIAADESFAEGHLVMNAASDLFVEVLGTTAIHTREAVHASGLPLGAAVEISVRGRWQ